jgi:hypothetical protein
MERDLKRIKNRYLIINPHTTQLSESFGFFYIPFFIFLIAFAISPFLNSAKAQCLWQLWLLGLLSLAHPHTLIVS